MVSVLQSISRSHSILGSQTLPVWLFFLLLKALLTVFLCRKVYYSRKDRFQLKSFFQLFCIRNDWFLNSYLWIDFQKLELFSSSNQNRLKNFLRQWARHHTKITSNTLLYSWYPSHWRSPLKPSRKSLAYLLDIFCSSQSFFTRSDVIIPYLRFTHIHFNPFGFIYQQINTTD